MYNLKQAVALAFRQLLAYFQTESFQQMTGYIGMWTHPIKKISFCFCVDDFGFKYFKQQDAKELVTM